ncbi:2-amino-3-carboxylmuconate-6-semialdehyde decarboxylase [Zalerion maritima]|uniref:2-amino-3-carboxylmuconate-6-semialdehyde decarboxylase n=1 Tax=Zalerion maritima TaxID=339359 RepID=A0AAD5RFR8_9PEZI|nr:2-amino-3-carboxylmuconate-6-semialdehyde decarboxylase [Zalerion maritima]
MMSSRIAGDPIVDVHTHMYPPSYVKIMEDRNEIPMVRRFPGSQDPRLILLPSEVESMKSDPEGKSKVPGRPLTKHYASLDQKIHFMDTHKIAISVISLANPWFDFLDPAEAGPIADSVNDEFSKMCTKYPGRLFFFAALPLCASAEMIRNSIDHALSLPYCRGFIMGTSGKGKGMDDPEMVPILQHIKENMVFLHPHYGLPNEVYGPRAEEYGHVLPLALGFPMETTICVARMYLSGVFDKCPSLRLLLAHSGGTLPFLAGRIESCIVHDGHLLKEGRLKNRRTIWDVLNQQIYLDAVIYSDVGLRAAVLAGGVDRVMFGTDHPFFPPLETDEQGEWESVTLNVTSVNYALPNQQQVKQVLGGNAVNILKLERIGKEIVAA